MTENQVLLFLSTLPDIAPSKKFLILKEFNSFLDFYENIESEKQKILKIFTEKEYSKILDNYNNFDIEKVEDYLSNHKIGYITYKNTEFYEKFECLEDDKPLVLFFKGNINLINSLSVGIVGSRKYTYYGEKVTRNYSKELSNYGLTIISGLAEGIDSISHTECINNDGKTIAVLGGGFNNIYPSSNLGLFDKIQEKGLVLTEYFPTVKPKPYMFPRRNRIIASLSDALLVTEAGEKSGSLITASLCLDYGKDVFGVCGNIDSKSSNGVNELIKSGACFLTTTPLDIIEKFGLKPLIEKNLQNNALQNESICDIDSIEKAILEFLQFKEAHFDEIQEKVEIETKLLAEKLMLLELTGKIIKLRGNYYTLNS